jgi:hypothetical protein
LITLFSDARDGGKVAAYRKKGGDIMNIIKSDLAGYTNKCEAFYERFKDGFGNVVKATMEGSSDKVNFKLTLTNNIGEEMIIESGLTAGYQGAGSNATIRVLKSAGFDIEDEFVYRYVSFEIHN